MGRALDESELRRRENSVYFDHPAALDREIEMRAMAMELGDLTAPPTPSPGVEPGPIASPVAAELNDRAYGLRR